MKRYLYRETQYLPVWSKFLVVVPVLIGLYVLIKDVEIDTINLHNSDMLLLFIIIFIQIMLVVMILNFRLQTRIDHSSIQVKFSPFHKNFVEYPLNEISDMAVVKYNPIMDYGGWGIRGFGSNKAFNLRGNYGLKILLKNGNIRLIGTQNPEELNQVIKNLKSSLCE